MHHYDLNHEKASVIPVCSYVLKPLLAALQGPLLELGTVPVAIQQPQKEEWCSNSKTRREQEAWVFLFSLKAAIFLILSCIFQTCSLHLSRWSPGAYVREEFFLWLQWRQDSVHKVLKVVKTCNWCGKIQSATRPPETKHMIKRYQQVWISADSDISHSKFKKKQAQRLLQTKTMSDTCLSTWIAILCIKEQHSAGMFPVSFMPTCHAAPRVQSNSITESLIHPSDELRCSFLLHPIPTSLITTQHWQLIKVLPIIDCYSSLAT